MEFIQILKIVMLGFLGFATLIASLFTVGYGIGGLTDGDWKQGIITVVIAIPATILSITVLIYLVGRIP